MDLKDLRSEIDVIDRQIVELYEKRMDVASKMRSLRQLRHLLILILTGRV